MTLKNDQEPEATETTPEVAPLTDREKAILGGNDPDQVQVDEVEGDNEQDAGDGELPESKEAPGGTDAHDTPAVAGKIEPSWITAAIENEAGAYGLNRDDLLDLGDEDAYKRTKRVLARNLYQAGQAPAPAQQPAPAAAQPKEGENKKFTKYDLEKLKADGYDDHVLSLSAQINELIGHNEAVSQQLEAQRTAAQQQEYQRHIYEFNQTADQLDPDLFGKNFADGKPVKLSRDFEENRTKLYDAAMTIVAGLAHKAQAAGQEPKIPPMNVLLQQARDYAFADRLRERETRRRTEAIRKQSATRRPAPGRQNRTNPSTAVEKDPVKAISNSRAIADFFQNAQVENGVAA